jgi:hypothetical protein
VDYDINRHAMVLVRTHPTDIASSISLNADDEAREIGSTLLLQIDHRVSTTLHRKNKVVGLKGPSTASGVRTHTLVPDCEGSLAATLGVLPKRQPPPMPAAMVIASRRVITAGACFLLLM